MSSKRFQALRRKLILSTALIGGVVGIAQTAQAQDLPDTAPGTVITWNAGAGGGQAPVLDTGVPDTLTVNLRDNRTVITWQPGSTGFNIGAGKTVHFSDARSSVVGITGVTANAAVLNRDLSGGASNIAGALTSDSNVSVYLLNTNGILFGNSAAVSTGGFFASTREVSDGDFLTEDTTLSFSGSGSAGITIDSGATFATTGVGGASGAKVGDLVFLGASVNAPGGASNFTASGDLAFIAADDVQVTAATGSPLSMTISRGTAVPGAMKLSGTLQGRNVTVALATRGNVSDSVLSIDGMVTATGVAATDRGIVLTAGAAAPGVTLAGTVGTGPADDVQTFGSLAITAPLSSGTGIALRAPDGITTASLSADGDISADSAGTTDIASATSTAGALSFTGAGNKTFGALSAVSAAGNVTIGGAGSVTLNGATAIDAGGNVSIGSALGRVSSITTTTAIDADGSVEAWSTGAQSLGSVTSGGAMTLDSSADGVSFTTLTAGGNLTLAALTQVSGTSADSDGVLDIDAGTLILGTGAGDLGVSVTTSGAARANSLTASGATANVMVNAASLEGVGVGTRTALSAGGNVDVTTSGSAVLGAVQAGGAASVSGSSIDITSIDATLGAVIASATGGGATIGSGSSGTGFTVNATGAVAVLGNVTAGGSYSVSGAAVTLGGSSPATQSASGAVTITGTTISGQAGLTLQSNSDGVGTEALTLDSAGAITFASASDLRGGPARQSDILIRSGNTSAITLGNVAARGLQGATGVDPFTNGITRNAALAFGTINLQNPLALTGTSIGTGNITVSGGGATLTATGGGAITTGNIGVAGALDATTSGTAEFGQSVGGLVEASGAIDLDAGTLTTRGTVRSTGATVTLTGATSLDAGAVEAFGNATLSGEAISFTSISGATVSVTNATPASGTIDGGSITASNGATLSGGSIALTGGVTATSGNITVDSGGAVSFASLAADAGDVTIGSVAAPSSLTVTGAVTASGSIDAEAGSISVGSADATNGSVSLVATGGNLTVNGTTGAGTTVTLSSTATTQLNGAVTAGGAVNVSGVTAINFTTINGTAVSVTTANPASGTIGGTSITASNGATLSGGSITLTGAVNAIGGNIMVDSGGAVSFASLAADAGDITIGGVAAPSSLTVTGAVTASGSIDAEAGSISVGSADATNGSVSLVGTGGNLTVNGATNAGTTATLSSTATTQLNGAVTAGGAVNVSGVTAINFTTISGAAVSVTTATPASGSIGGTSITASNGATLSGGIITLTGGISATGGNIAVDSTGAVSFASLAADAGDITIGGVATPSSLTVTGAVTASGSIDAEAGSISVGSADATSGSVSLVATGGNLTVNGTTNAGTTATLSSTATTQLNGAVTAGGAANVSGTTAINFTSISGDTVQLTGGAVSGATLTGANGVDVLAGNGITLTDGAYGNAGTAVLHATGGAISTVRISGTAVTVTADAGAATVSGNVTATAGDYTVTGVTVTLGGSIPTLQQASGAIGVHATGANGTGNGIIGTAGLTLRSNSGNLADAGNARGIALTTDAGGIAFGETTLEGSTTRASAVTIAAAPATAPVVLGTVNARALLGLSARQGAVTLGNVTVTDALTVQTSAGNVLTGNIVSDGSITLGTAGGTVTGGNLTSNGGAIGVSASAAVTLGTVLADDDVTVTANNGDLIAGDVTSNTGNVTLTASGIGSIDADAVSAGLSAQVRGAMGVSLASFLANGGTGEISSSGGAVTLTGSATATGSLTIGAAGAVSATGLSGSTLDVTGASIDADTATSTTGMLRLVASGNITVETISSAGTATLRTTATGSILAGSIDAVANVVIDSAAAVRTDSVTSSGGRIDMDAAGAVTGRAIAPDATDGRMDPGFGRAALASATGVRVTAGGLVQLGAVLRGTGAGDITGTAIDVESASIDLTSAHALGGGLSLVATNGPLLLGDGSATGAARLDKQAGAGELVVGTLTAGSATIDSNTHVRAGSLTATSGGVRIGAAGEVTGLGVPGSYGRTTIGATGPVSVIAGTLAQLGAITSGPLEVRVANGLVDIDGAVTVTGNILLSGRSVTLGVSGTTQTMRATGAVRVIATAGSIRGGAGLTLVANSDDTGAGAEAMTLDATGGDIIFAPGSTLLGGASNRSSNIGIRLGTPGSALALGTVRARSLRGVDAAGTGFGGLTTTGAITLGNVSVRNALDIRTSGSIATGPVSVTGTRQSLTLIAGTTLSATGTLSSQGDLRIESGGDLAITTAVSNAGNATLLAGGNASGDLLRAAGSVTETVTGTDTITQTRAGQPAMFASDADSDPNPGAPDPTPTPSPVAGAGNVRIVAGSVDKDVVWATGTLQVTANAGQLRLRTLGHADGDVTLVKTGAAGELIATAIEGASAEIVSSTHVRLGSVTTTASTGKIDIKATGNVTGLRLGVSVADGRPDGDYGRAELRSAGGVFVVGGAIAQLGTVTRNAAAAGEVTADRVDVFADAIDLSLTVARTGALTLTATSGRLALGTGTAGTSATLIKQGTIGALTVGSLTAGTNATATSSTSADLGSITATTGNVVVTATDAASVSGNVIAGNNYQVTGATVSLGVDGDSETQSAANRIEIRSTNGAIRGGQGLTLMSNSGGVADAGRTRTLNLDATNGAILFDLTSALFGGPGRQSAIGINLRTGGTALELGRVDARELRTVNAALTDYSAPIATTGNIVLGRVQTVESIDVRTTAGSIRTGGLASTGGDINLAASQSVAVGTDLPIDASFNGVALSGRDIAVTAGTSASLARMTATRDVSVTAGTSAALAQVTATRNVVISAGTTVQVTGETSGASISVTAGSSAALARVAATGGVMISAGTSVQVTGETSGATISVTAGSSAALARVNATGDVVISAGTSVQVTGEASGRDISITAGTSAALAAVTSSRDFRLSSASVELNGIVRATSSVQLRNTGAGPTRLGTVSGTDLADPADTNTPGFDLSAEEVNRIDAPVVVIDSVAHDVFIRGLALTHTPTRFDVLTTGRIRVTGTVSMGGTGTLRLGGTAAALPADPNALPAMAASILVAATPGGGGRIILTGGADLDLRAHQIAVGQWTDLSQIDVTWLGNPDSPLYRALSPYTNLALISADTLTVRYSSSAFFQNTGQGQSTSGVTIGALNAPNTLGLTSTGSAGSNSFALFGTINDRTGSSAALLGPTVIGINGVNLNQARINGCLIGSGGGGCLITVVTVPQITVFDPSQANILSVAANLQLSFDPMISTGNESLFSDPAVTDPITTEKCQPDGETPCQATGTNVP